MLGFTCDPPIPVAQFALWIYEMKMIYVRFNVVNSVERKDIFRQGKLEISGYYTWIGLCRPIVLIFIFSNDHE